MFVLGAIGDTGYNIMLFVHIIGMFVAFAPNFANPSGAVSADGGAKLRKMYAPALAVSGLIGFGLAGMSGKDANDELIYSVSQPWLSAAALLWFIALGLMFALIAPAQDKVAAGDQSAAKIVSAATGGLHLVLVIALYLMIWKPGL